MGKTRGKLFRDGGLTPKQFADLQLDRNFKPLTLEDIKAKEPLVFDRAIGDSKSFKQPSQSFNIYDDNFESIKPDVSTPLKRAVVEFENKIRNLEMERGAFFADDGSVILQLTGSENRLTFDSKLVHVEDSVFTHNHPGSSSFSYEDIITASELNLQEIRVVTRNMRYSMRKGDKGWTTEKELLATAKILESRANDIVKDLINTNEVHISNATQEKQHQLWRLIADRLQLIYKREKS